MPYFKIWYGSGTGRECITIAQYDRERATILLFIIDFVDFYFLEARFLNNFSSPASFRISILGLPYNSISVLSVASIIILFSAIMKDTANG